MLMAGRSVRRGLFACVGGTGTKGWGPGKFTLYLFRFTFGSHWLPGNSSPLLVQRATFTGNDLNLP